MLLGGDEFGRTQQGNNNAYCQDNPISWYDWRLLERNKELYRFCKEIIRFRKENPVFRRSSYFTGQPGSPGGKPDVVWCAADGKPQTWLGGDDTLACWINGLENNSAALYLMFNPTPKPVKFRVPKGHWVRRIDTAQPSPQDIMGPDEAPMIEHGKRVLVADHALVVLSSSGKS
jgi:glycogen operon protein